MFATTRNLATLTIAGSALLLMQHAVAQLLPIERFTMRPAIGAVSISPSGNRVALSLAAAPGGLHRLGVIDLDAPGKPRIVAEFPGADVGRPVWVNDERILFDAVPRDVEVDEAVAGTFAVNHDGTLLRQLVTWRTQVTVKSDDLAEQKLLARGWFWLSSIPDGGSEVFFTHRVEDSRGDLKQVELARVDTLSGNVRNLSFGMPEGTRSWVRDRRYEPRLVTTYLNGRAGVHWRNPETNQWEQVAEFDPFTEPGFSPVYVDDAGQVFVTSRRGGDFQAVYRFDPKTRLMDPEPVLQREGFDLALGAESDPKTRRLLGAHFLVERPNSHWFDPALQRIQVAVDAALPQGRTNRLICGECESTRFFVVHSASDRQPGVYFVFDREKSALTHLGDVRPWIDESTQGQRSLHRVVARDGLELPVYVTHPVGAGPEQALPAVMLVHGGPYVRGSSLSWDEEAQLLASRGYRVLQPEFRGSTGYGYKLYRAGWKQWGRAMQTDLVDVVQWAAKQGLIDPARVCIMGTSYGGYAALMGVITTPQVYQCAASFAGVTDVSLMYDLAWSDVSQDFRKHGMPVLIGDPVKDADVLASMSPVQRVAEIKVPVMLAQGGLDRRVPRVHSLKFRAAARGAGVRIESVDYPKDGHGFFKPGSATDYYTRLEKFLATSLKATP